MVTQILKNPKQRKSESGALATELMVAMAILVLGVIPLAFTYPQEEKLLRSSYQRAVIMEIVDGEMEILQSGEWRSYKEGTQPYAFHEQSATNLPPGRAELTVNGKHLRLDWLPDKKSSGGEVAREAELK